MSKALNAKKWQISNVCASDDVKKYASNDLLAKLLAARGILTQDDAKTFLNPLSCESSAPNVFADMPKAVSRIKEAIEKKEHILIWGDFDADGVTSTALLYKTFKKLGAKFSHFIPEREAHGHGLDSGVLLKLVSKHKVKVVVTVDCGVSDAKEIALLKGFQVDVIITDHHRAPDVLPEAYAIINPCAQGALAQNLDMAQISSLCALAGVGVAYKLALSLLDCFKINDEHLKNELSALVAIGTISDIVPLQGENRGLVARGLKCLEKGENTLKGVQALFRECKKTTEITSVDIAFILTPRINAVGRLSSADEAFNLLVNENDMQLAASIEHLNNSNKIRQSLCENIFREALFEIEKDPNFAQQKALVLFNSSWHLGVIGIVASKLVEAFNKPVFLATQDASGICRMSARGVLGYNIYEVISENAGLLTGFGGHALAGGLSFDPKVHSYETVKAALLKTFDEQPEVEVSNVLEIDAELDPSELNKELLETIALLEPFGQKNPPPVFCIKNARLLSHSFVGKEKSHLKYFCEKDGINLSCVWWSHSEFDLQESALLNIAFSPRLSEYQGVETIQLETCDIESQFLKAPAPLASPLNAIKFYDHRAKNLADILPEINKYLANPNIDLSVVAVKSSTLNALKPYPAIFERTSTPSKSSALMFFDYPPSRLELKSILKNSGANKVHLMAEEFDEDINSYLQRLSGMLKFISNKKGGQIELGKITKELSLTESFVALAFKLFEELGVIKLVSKNKIEYLKAFQADQLEENPYFETLLEDFEKTMEFKTAIVYSEDYEAYFA
ncbi:single-stranded-DNA-specific exonuclease [Candidatus Gastranaerophilus sp. (ex Termes propinquus)]|nr:single-stranded-DNA-specific exonuclease [Candidatus Gastranaerophilus sp. (ex Termes propinquus)]